MRAVSSPQTKAPAPFLDLHIEVEIGAQDLLAQKTHGLGIGHRLLDVSHGNRIFRPHIDIALLGADGIGGDEHPFEDGVGIAFENGPVHEGPRVSFVGIADDVLHISLGVAGKLPFVPRGKPCPAPASQPGADDLLDDLFRAHGGEDLGDGQITVASDVILDPGGIDLPAIAQDDLHLLPIKRNILFQSDWVARFGDLCKEASRRASLRSDSPGRSAGTSLGEIC